MPPPTRQDDWIADFANEIMRLRPYLSARLATVYALWQWPRRQALKGGEAARAWHAESAPPRRT